VIKLNCGCGGEILPNSEGWVNIDYNKGPGVDSVIDLEKDDLDCPENSVDHILLRDFLEHLSKWRQQSFLENVYKILKPGRDIYIQLPDLETLAQRYLNVLENPTDMQHSLTAEQFAASLYGGQEYEGNYHKWGYDIISLSRLLINIGFMIKYIHGDGGQNLLCGGIKPPEKVYLAVGGGLGDVIQICLANPCDHHIFNEFPSANPISSIWLHRLKSLKEKYNMIIRLYVHSHNINTYRLFSNNPYIDELINIEWLDNKLRDESNHWLNDIDGYTSITKFEEAYKFIHSSNNAIFLNEREQTAVDKIKMLGKYIVVHPFAGNIHRVVPNVNQYLKIVRVLQSKYRIVVIGQEGEIFPDNIVVNLIGKVNPKVSVNLILNASGFIGTHSSMILPAWYRGIPTVCLVPPTHEGGQTFEEFFNSDNPTVWGNKRPINKTIVVRDNNIEIDSIVEHFNNTIKE
jgi:predicted SAM-dependent methyltransferase